MNKKKYILAILLTIIGLQITHGQETDLLDVRSPQSADIMRYGNVPVSKNSGRLDLSINLLTLEDQDFNFPISIRYNSAGYMPSKAESAVGLDWALITGGAIYREVRGIPDDWDQDPRVANDVRKGFLHVVKDNINLNKNDIYNNPTQYMDVMQDDIKLKNSKIEAASDVYHFSFGPYSGKFTIGFNGKANIVSTTGGKFIVNLSGYNYYGSGQSVIKITTDNGYVYSFGGTKDAMEYTINYKNSINYDSWIYISSFHLYEILAPNGRKLEIKYTSVGNLHEYPTEALSGIGSKSGYLKNYSLSLYPVQFQTRYSYRTYETKQMLYSYTIPVFQDVRTLTKVALIDEIKTDVQTLKFHYTSRPNAIYSGTVPQEFPVHSGAKLDSIRLQQNSHTVKAVRFGYTTYDKMSRFFLNKLTLSGGEVYNFDYKHDYAFPSPATKDIDYWGFWRNKGNDVSVVVPDYYNDILFITSRAKAEAPQKGFDHALLKSITYPTGGRTDIEYEHHEYAKKIDINTNGNFNPFVQTWEQDLMAGGARVKYLRNSVNGKTETKLFKYVMDPKDNNSRSSGIISNYPRYADSFFIPKEGSNAHVLTNDRPSYSPTHGINFQSKYMDHIAYSKVTEIQIEEESIIRPKQYHFVSPPLLDIGQEVIVFNELSLETTPNQYTWSFKGELGGDPSAKAYIS